MKKTELVVFDVDGLMLNTEFLWQKAHEITAEKYHEPGIGKEFFHAGVGLTGNDFRKIMDQWVPDKKMQDFFLEEIRKEGEKLLEEELDVMPGLLNLLSFLDEKKIHKAVATTTFHEKTEKRLKRMHLWDRFNWILCGDEVKNRKPDPEIYNTVAEHFHIPKEHILVLEDSCYGVEAAYRAGLRCIMVPSVVEPSKKQKREADCIVNNLFEVRKILAAEAVN